MGQGAKIMSCSATPSKCRSKYQDEMYGLKKRVHSQTDKVKGNQIGYRCSICKKINYK